MKESTMSHFSILVQGNSTHSAQVSNPCFFMEQVMMEQVGCLSKKLGPQHPGHLDGPLV